MGPIILFAIAAIIWSVINAASQQQQPKRPVPRQAVPRPASVPPAAPVQQPAQTPPASTTFAEQREVIQTVDLDAPSRSFRITAEDLVQSVIMAEVLGPPRARNPHRPGYKR